MEPASPDPNDLRLTGTSHVVLGMLDRLGPSTPYRLKRVLTESVEDVFPVPHTSFYAEPARLARAGYVSEDQEPGGRRRKTYALTGKGKQALDTWLRDGDPGYGEFRFPGMLKLFFGADPVSFARDQEDHHRALADRFATVHATRAAVMPEGRRLVLETGIRVHTWWGETRADVAARAERPPAANGDEQL